MVKNVKVLDEQQTVNPNTLHEIARIRFDIDRDRLNEASDEELEEAGKRLLKSLL